ncbi:MAG: NUDIX domain-containing protein [bacterium]|nr:NUDIX domain-containing protein [bacterium]
MSKKEIKFAPREIFEQILEWSVIPTFDLIIEYGNQGILLVKRKNAPYKNQWALPGLRMFKGEEIDDVLARIAKNEVGIQIDPKQKHLINQYVGKFSTEYKRQDISTGYSIRVDSAQPINLNKEHFFQFRIITSHQQIPSPMGAMYSHYLKEYFSNR